MEPKSPGCSSQSSGWFSSLVVELGGLWGRSGSVRRHSFWNKKGFSITEAQQRHNDHRLVPTPFPSLSKITLAAAGLRWDRSVKPWLLTHLALDLDFLSPLLITVQDHEYKYWQRWNCRMREGKTLSSCTFLALKNYRNNAISEFQTQVNFFHHMLDGLLMIRILQFCFLRRTKRWSGRL